MPNLFKKFFISAVCPLLPLLVIAQMKVIKGVVKDAQTNERIPYASLIFKSSKIGVLSDSTGNFLIRHEKWPVDTIEVSFVGYETQTFVLHLDQDTTLLEVSLNYRENLDSVLILSTLKGNKGLLLWRRIVSNKPKNNPSRFDRYSFEKYSKVEIDFKNVNFEKISIFNPLWFFKRQVYQVNDITRNNVDSVTGSTYLPVYIAETISDYFHQKKPFISQEVVRAKKNNGIKQDGLLLLLDEMVKSLNVYLNFIPVYNKPFISPLSDFGDHYYNYNIRDTQLINGHRYYHLYFKPKRRGENTFEGDCQVHAGSFAIQSINLHLTKEANINFLENLYLSQEFQLINNSDWFPAREKYTVAISPAGRTRPGFVGQKINSYRNIIVNDSTLILASNKGPTFIDTLISMNPESVRNSHLAAYRHDTLSKHEIAQVNILDTLLNSPSFQQLTKGVKFMATGYINTGNVQHGPWFYWFTGNAYEGFRMRYDLRTNHHFHKKLWLHGYLAYGFTDQKFKGKAEALYLFNKLPRTSVQVSYLNDLDFGQQYYREMTTDNVFALAIRKSNIPIKFMKAEEKRFELFHETRSGISTMFTLSHRTFSPLKNLPLKESFSELGENAMTTFEAGVRLRLAIKERFVENHFFRTSLGSHYPITELNISRGIAGLLNSNYNYTKLSGNLSHFVNIPPLGSLLYNLYGGFTSGTLPYVFLDIHPGNELYYYNKNAFNMMNRYEFISDRYTGFSVEHNFGKGIFRFIPSLKWRQFWNAKVLRGRLSTANQQLNFRQDYHFKHLNNKTYAEVGTGIDNILRIMRLDLVWKVSPKSSSGIDDSFGVFGSFKLSF